MKNIDGHLNDEDINSIFSSRTYNLKENLTSRCCRKTQEKLESVISKCIKYKISGKIFYL